MCFIYSHFTGFYEKQLEDEAMHHKTGKELVGLIPALRGVLWPVIRGVNQSHAGKEPLPMAALPLEKAEKQQGQESRACRKSSSHVLSSKLGKKHILTDPY